MTSHNPQAHFTHSLPGSRQLSRVWGLTEGSAGMASQVQALAAAMARPVEMKAAVLKPALRWLPNEMVAMFAPIIPLPENIFAPYPDMVISCGRKAAAVALAIRARAPQVKLVHIGDPYVSPNLFSAVVAMAHDAVGGKNVYKTRFALHAVTPQALQEAAAKFGPALAMYPGPYTSVLVGGSTHKYTLTPPAMAQLCASLRELAAQARGSLLVTASRRTGAQNLAMLEEALGGLQNVYLYDGSGENPYLGLLALADTIFVTNDSVNMMSEAAATGKPVYLLPLAGHEATKPARFAQGLIAEGIARTWEGKLEKWSYAPGDDMRRVAEFIQSAISR